MHTVKYSPESKLGYCSFPDVPSDLIVISLDGGRGQHVTVRTRKQRGQTDTVRVGDAAPATLSDHLINRSMCYC